MYRADQPLHGLLWRFYTYFTIVLSGIVITSKF